jgi:hypothetical protein
METSFIFGRYGNSFLICGRFCGGCPCTTLLICGMYGHFLLIFGRYGHSLLIFGRYGHSLLICGRYGYSLLICGRGGDSLSAESKEFPSFFQELKTPFEK